MAGPFEFALENEKLFKEQLEELRAVSLDLRIPFTLIARDFYQSEKKIFALKGPGRYADLKDTYKERKQREVGFIYPMLFKTGRLAKSLLDPSSPEAETYIGKQELVLGTSVPYAIYHQSDEPRSRLPQRKVVFIDGGPLDEAKDGKYGRRERWANIIFNYIKQKTTGEV